MTILIWFTCIPVFWTAADAPEPGYIVGYHVEVGGESAADVSATTANICLDTRYTPVEVKVQAFGASGDTGPWSEVLTLMRVHNFDSDDSGLVGIEDYGRFYQDYGMRYKPSGVAVRRE